MVKLSIIIPIFNSFNTLRKTVDSIISQDYLYWELILVNDGSTDHSKVLAQSYLKNPKVSYVYQKNAGVSAARNFGASLAKGDWLIFLDSDDYFESDSLLKIANNVELSLEFAFCQFGFNKVRKNKISCHIPQLGKYFPKLSGTFVIKRSIFNEVAGYDARLKFSENTELFHRVELAGFRGKSVSEIILNYSDNPSGGSKNLQNMIDSLTLIIDKHSETLTPHVKRLYHQIIGVNYMRFGQFGESREHLLKAYLFNLKKLDTLGRYFVSLVPPIAKIIYRPNPKI